MTSFSRVVCAHEAVRSAFDSYSGARLWWRAVLWLHGKPTAPHLTREQRTQVLADGFRFYAQIYRFLASLFVFAGATGFALSAYASRDEANYWTGATVLAALFLWFASGVGFAGAKSLRIGLPSAKLLLVAFMVSLVMFLAALLAVLSVVAHAQNLGNIWLNLGSVALVWCFGIGSYGIEILYLVAEERL